MDNIKKAPSSFESIMVIGISLLFVIIGTVFLKLKAEILLCIMATFAAICAFRLGYKWSDLEEAITERIRKTVPVLMMIWTIGMVVASFIYSGTIPMLIYYGLKMIEPSMVVLSAFLTCIVFSVATGSSWSSVGTAGVVFMGVAAGMDVPLNITAGAVIAGAVFGDKLSPLSETTNLAPLCAGANLYDHIKSMFWTTLPPTIIAGIVYAIVGMRYSVTDESLPAETIEMINSLNDIYNWNIILIIPFLIILGGAVLKKPTVPTLFIAVLSAMIIGVTVQGFSIQEAFSSALNGFNVANVYDGPASDNVLTLLNRGGIKSMAGVVIIVFCGYTFAAIISKAGYLETACKPIINTIKCRWQLILATLGTVLFIFLATGNSYVAFILVPELYRKKFAELSIAPRVLSRSLEDVGTVTGSLIPWSGSAVFYAGTLGVAIYGAEGYAFWTMLPYLSPLFAILWGITGIGIKRLTEKEREEMLKELDEVN